MMACCGCLRSTGYCKRCTCVKAGWPCVDCVIVGNCHNVHMYHLCLASLIFLTLIEMTSLMTLVTYEYPLSCLRPPLPLACCLPPTFLPLLLCLPFYCFLHSPCYRPDQTPSPSPVSLPTPQWWTRLCLDGVMLTGLPCPLKFVHGMKGVFTGEKTSSRYLQVKLVCHLSKG